MNTQSCGVPCPDIIALFAVVPFKHPDAQRVRQTTDEHRERERASQEQFGIIARSLVANMLGVTSVESVLETAGLTLSGRTRVPRGFPGLCDPRAARTPQQISGPNALVFPLLQGVRRPLREHPSVSRV